MSVSTESSLAMELTESEEKSDRNAKSLGFQPQKLKGFCRILPYADQLDEESNRIFSDLKANIGRAILTKDIHSEAFMWWLFKGGWYLNVNSYKFSKEDHVLLIKIMYEIVIMENISDELLVVSSAYLATLSRKVRLLTPDDLQIQWRPLYDQYKRASHKRLRPTLRLYSENARKAIMSVVKYLKFYFPPSSTAEILEELRPRMNPSSHNGGCGVIEELNVFLPVHTWQNNATYELWLDDMLSTWETCLASSAYDSMLMELIAQVSSHHIGRIDWEPHMVTMFSRFLHWLNLPVNYEKGDKYSPYRSAPMNRAASWIVSTLGGRSSGQRYLSELLSVLGSFFYPANTGRWVDRISDFLSDLSEFFVRRVVTQRKGKHHWMDSTDTSHYLTEEEITLFVESLCPFIQQAICNVHGKDKMISAARLLAWIRPQIIIPPILERLYDSLNSLTEPHRFTSALLFAKSMVWPMVLGHEQGYPEGPDHIVPLLTAVLPGIDANDTFKTLTTFTFIMSVSFHVPFIDCSNAIKDTTLTEREQDLCRASAGLEDFIVQLIDRMLILVRNGVLDDISLHAQKNNFVFLKEILAQTSLPIFKGLLRKFHDFIQSNILENNAFLLMLASSFSSANPTESLRMLLPPIVERILVATESPEVQKEAKLDSELMYCLQLFASLTDVTNGHVFLPYMDQILSVLDRTLRLENVQGQTAALQALKQVVSSLSSVAIEDSLCVRYEELKQKNHIFVRDWGAPSKNSDYMWKLPCTEDVQCIQMVFNKFVPSILKDIEGFIADSSSCSREDLAKSLSILCQLLSCDTLLPFWKEEPLKVGSGVVVVPNELKVVSGIEGEVTMPDGSNVRLSVVQLMQRLQVKLLSYAEDDIKALSSVISIMHAMLTGKTFKEMKQSKGFKSTVINPIAKRRYCRFLGKIELLNLHNERQSLFYTPWNNTILGAVLSIVDLATSRYSKVRVSAQKALGNICSNLSPVRNSLVPKLVENLKKDATENHDLMKGTYYTICSLNALVLGERALDLWPSLVTCAYSEKQSIINIRRHIQGLFMRDWALSLEEEVSDSLFELAHSLWKNEPIPKIEPPSEEEVMNGEKYLVQRNQEKQEDYNRVVNELYLAIRDGKVHWNHSTLAVTMLCALRQQTSKYPAQVVSCVLRFLVHDSMHLRNIATSFVVIAMKQLKRKTVKTEINPESLAKPDGTGGFTPTVGDNRPDNNWLQYHKDSRPLTEEQWNNQTFLDDITIGFNVWPRPLMVCCPANQHPPIEKRTLSETEEAVIAFFQDAPTVERLLDLFCSEHQTQVKIDRLFLWQYVFHIIEDQCMDVFRTQLERLIAEKRDPHSLCAAEIISGIVYASKHWTFEKVTATWQWLIPMLRPVISINNDIISAWSVTLYCALRRQDPRRYHWLIEMLMEEPLSEDSKYLECGRLKILTALLLTCSWRMNSLKHRLLDYIRPMLKHPFHGIRQHLVKTLPHVFFYDFNWPGALPSHSPRWAEFIPSVLPDLDGLKAQCAAKVESTKEVINGVTMNEEKLNSKLMMVDLTEEDRESDLRVFKTIVGSIKDSIPHASYTVKPCFYQLLELCAILDNTDKNEKDAHDFLVKISRALVLPEVLPQLLESIKKTEHSPFWNVRVSGLKVLQVCVLHNSILFRRKESWVEEVLSMVLRLLEDTRVEVQQMAGTVLSGLLHIRFVPEPMILLEEMKVKANTKLYKSKGKEIMFERLCIRHGGVIGLCAFVSAFPYDIPDYVPDLLSLLGSHLNDYHPIPATVRQTLNDFKRTHATDWEQHKLRFSEEQLEVFKDLVIPPMYIT